MAAPIISDPVERPVFMHAQRGPAFVAGAENCVMYIDGDNTDEDYSDDNTEDDSGATATRKQVQYISTDFNAHPTLFVAGSELLVRKLLIKRSDLGDRFRLIEPPKPLVTKWLRKNDDDQWGERWSCLIPCRCRMKFWLQLVSDGH
jgi:hypothetical protein